MDSVVTQQAQPGQWAEGSLPARKPVPEAIAEVIMGELRAGTLRPGDKLPAEPELARQLKVGRTSLREAIRTLDTLGVLEVVRGRGTFVRHPPSVDELSDQFVQFSVTGGPAAAELLEVRIGLEGTAATLACLRATAEDLDLMAQRCREHEAARRRGDLDELVRTDEAVHESLVLASHNELLVSMYRSLVPGMAEFRRHTLALDDAAERFDPQHRNIVAHIRNHDAAAARAAVVRHVGALYGEVRLAADEDDPVGNMLDFGAILRAFT